MGWDSVPAELYIIFPPSFTHECLAEMKFLNVHHSALRRADIIPLFCHLKGVRAYQHSLLSNCVILMFHAAALNKIHSVSARVKSLKRNAFAKTLLRCLRSVPMYNSNRPTTMQGALAYYKHI